MDKKAPHQPLLIVGASARAAAQSARRSGFSPYAVDMFADRDLIEACERVVRVATFPRGVDEACRSLPPMTWMYVGGLENYPDLVDRITRRVPLLGNPGDVLRKVRDPARLTTTLSSHGISTARIALSDEQLPTSGRWLLKPLRSGGGRGIREWTAGERSPSAGEYLQEFVAGQSRSGVFLAANGKAKFVGVTKQWVGEEWLAAPKFAYCGSIGPLSLSLDERVAWRRIGRRLAKEFSLRGIFGVDAIVNEERVTPVEVNPRYTASVEIFERSGWPAMTRQLQACLAHLVHSNKPMEGDFEPVESKQNHFGKAIVYARYESVVEERLSEFMSRANEFQCSLADIPAVGEPIMPGSPVATILAQGATLADVERRLRGAAEKMYRILTPPTASSRN